MENVVRGQTKTALASYFMLFIFRRAQQATDVIKLYPRELLTTQHKIFLKKYDINNLLHKHTRVNIITYISVYLSSSFNFDAKMPLI